MKTGPVFVILLILVRVDARPQDRDDDPGQMVLPSCVKMSDLSTSSSLVSLNSMGELVSTFSSCLSSCLTSHPKLPVVMVGQSAKSASGHQFVCVCASMSTLTEAMNEELAKCNVSCPDNPALMCGNASEELLSVYCTKLACASHSTLCREPRPNRGEGCISASGLKREYLKSVRLEERIEEKLDFNHLCIEACLKHTAAMVYALTSWSLEEENSMCMCTDSHGLDVHQVVSPEFCHHLQEHNSRWLDVHCLNDLPVHYKPLVLQEQLGSNCIQSSALACVYDELLPSQPLIEISANISKDEPVFSSVSKCRDVCHVLFPSSSHVAIRHDEISLKCVCMEPDSLITSMVGPDVACHMECDVDLMCGGHRLHPAMSVYCIIEKKLKGALSRSDSDSLATENTLDTLQDIHESLRRENVLATLIVGLLTFLALIILAMVAYLCYANGLLILSN